MANLIIDDTIIINEYNSFIITDTGKMMLIRSEIFNQVFNDNRTWKRIEDISWDIFNRFEWKAIWEMKPEWRTWIETNKNRYLMMRAI